jgi:hypothetical protein
VEVNGMNRQDAHSFCKYTGIDVEDLLKSKAVQKQFKLFQEGVSSQFIEQARAKMKADGY